MRENNRKLCVMQVLPELVTGGVERGTLDIASALIEAGHEAIVVSNGGPMVEALRSIGAQHIELPVHSKNPFIIRRNANRLAALMRSLNVDVLHARSRAPAWSCFWASRQVGVPFVTTFHGTYGHGNRLKRCYNRVMCRGDYTIAVSEFIEEHIRTVYGEPNNVLKVIHRGIDMALFDSEHIDTSELDGLRTQWDVPENKKIILLPGRLTRWKGQLNFIDAFAKLDRGDTYALIVGSDQGRDYYSTELKERIAQHGLKDRIKLCGHYSNMTLAYALSDIVVSASNEPEAFGRVACEAQAMGCLVVATQHGGAKETIAPVQRAWQCKPDNTDSLAQALNKALEVSTLEQADVAQQSREYINQNFSLSNMCKKTLEIYELASASNKY